MSNIKAYFYHPNSEGFFMDDFDSIFEEHEEVIKIGLVKEPSINDLMSKVIKRFHDEHFVYIQAMHLVEIDEKGVFVSELDLFYEKPTFTYAKGKRK